MPCRRLLLIPMLLAVLVAAAPSARAVPPAPPVWVVVHPDVPDEQVSRQHLKRIYLGKASRWEGGLSIHPVVFQGDPAHAWFVEEYLDRSPESFSVYWKRMVFTGKGRPPLAFDDPAALGDYVRSTPGAIGFLPAGADTTGLRVVALD
jgi:ABC-type phosphate transport system substrate-binding protein